MPARNTLFASKIAFLWAALQKILAKFPILDNMQTNCKRHMLANIKIIYISRQREASFKSAKIFFAFRNARMKPSVLLAFLGHKKPQISSINNSCFWNNFFEGGAPSFFLEILAIRERNEAKTGQLWLSEKSFLVSGSYLFFTCSKTDVLRELFLVVVLLLP